MGWGGVGWANNVHVPVHTQTQQTLASFFSPADTGTFLGMGWGGVITFMFLCTHTGTATLSSFLLSCRHRHYSWLISYRWGGVIMFMFLFTHRHTQPVHLSCSPADTGTTLSWSVTGGVGWGGVGWGGEMLVCPVQGPQPFPIGTCPLNICNPIGFYLGTLRPPTSWFAACKWWMMPVISCRLWII